MTFALKVTPFSVKSLSEASVSVDRFKVSSHLASVFSLSVECCMCSVDAKGTFGR